MKSNNTVVSGGKGSLNLNTGDGKLYVDIDGLGNWVAVGSQTSSRETKQDIVSFHDHEGALQKVLSAPLSVFRYRDAVNVYESEMLDWGVGDWPLPYEPRPPKSYVGFIAEEVDPQFLMPDGTIDQVSANGILMAAVKALQKQIDMQSRMIEVQQEEIERLGTRLGQ